jgi:PAS domain S-box-containing protein
MKKELSILLVEDNEGDIRIIKELLKEQSFMIFNITLAGSLDEAIKKLSVFAFDTILLDLGLPDSFGFETFRKLNVLFPRINAIIILTGLNDTEVGLKAVNQGAQDYIIKGQIDSDKLLKSIIYSNERNRLHQELKLQLEARRVAEEELHMSELKLQKAQAISHVGSWELNLSTKSIWCSEEALRIYGFDLENRVISLELVQKSTLPDYRALLVEALENLLKYNEPYDVEYNITNIKDGTIRSIYSKAELMLTSDSNLVKVIGVIQDITSLKRAEAELIKAKNKAEESDSLKTAFLHNISHEIRTPMNAIVGFSMLLGEPDVDAQSRHSYIEVIIQSSNHLLAIITDIVDIANLEANLVKIEKNEINFNSTLKLLCDQFLLKAEEKKIQFICETGVPDSDALGITDSTKLTQILTNLINNAIKFTDIGYVKVSCKLKDQFLEFCVSDTGIGIPYEHHKRIFDRFYQVQATLSKLYEGTGLGLAISKAYVELLGGEMWLSSEIGKGTSFFFTIPYERQAVEPIAVNEKRVTENFVFQKIKIILVAEDSDSNFILIENFLSGTNTSILRAINGKESVEKCLSNKNIDLVLMDIKMPVMDGYTAVKLIRETNSTIPIIAQTAFADEKELAILSGCSGFISKPFNKKELLEIIHEFI